MTLLPPDDPGEPNVEQKNFWQRITPGNWITMVVVVAGVVASWQRMDSTLGKQNDSLIDLKAAISKLASVDALTNLQRDIDKDISAIRQSLDTSRIDTRTTFDAITARVSLLGERTNDTSREAAQLATEISNLKDAVTELRRQARISLPSSSSGIPGSSFGGGPR